MWRASYRGCVWSLIRSDLDAAGYRWGTALRRIGQLDGFWLAVLYRIAHALYVRQVPLLPHVLGWGVARVLFAAEINPGAQIGPGLRFVHTTGVVIGPAVIGANVRIYQNVTVGVRSERDPRLPTIGDRVTMYAGAVIAGPVVLASDSRVGANEVVTSR